MWAHTLSDCKRVSFGVADVDHFILYTSHWVSPAFLGSGMKTQQYFLLPKAPFYKWFAPVNTWMPSRFNLSVSPVYPWSHPWPLDQVRLPSSLFPSQISILQLPLFYWTYLSILLLLPLDSGFFEKRNHILLLFVSQDPSTWLAW